MVCRGVDGVTVGCLEARRMDVRRLKSECMDLEQCIWNRQSRLRIVML